LTIFHVLISWSGKAFEFSSTGFSFLDCTYYPNLRSKLHWILQTNTVQTKNHFA